MIARNYSATSFPSVQGRELLTVQEASQRFNISPATIRSWTNLGKLPTLRTLGGHRRLSSADILKMIGGAEAEETRIENGVIKIAAVIRVSGAGQSRAIGNSDKSSLEHQRDRVKDYVQKHYPLAETTWYSSIGSGLNFERPEFLKLIEDILAGRYRNGVVVSSDFTRICRFGIKLFEHICKLGECRIEYTLANDEIEKTENETLTDDVLSILTHFTAKASGRKSKKITEIVLDERQLKDAYLWFKSGCSYRTIAERLESEGRRKDLKGKAITHNVVRNRLLEHWVALERLYGETSTTATNSFIQFAESKIVKASKETVLKRTEMVNAYEKFCEANGLQPLKKTELHKLVQKLGWKQRFDNSKSVIYLGVALVPTT